MENLISNPGNTNFWIQNVIRVQDAIIQRIFVDNRGIGYVTISFRIMNQFNMVSTSIVTLIVGPTTIILDQYDQVFPFWNLKVGMIVNADFSSKMTRSIPPQSQAFRIIVSHKNWPYYVKVDRVMEVDVKNRYLYTGNKNDIYSQTRFVVTKSAIITDRRGNRITLGDIRPGQTVRIEHAIFQTDSIPPQTTAFSVHVL
ncbi:hypothetical protein [Candidatus Clostridium radicumherbarum]|uniref:Uncharacterized protein n=1 Tax=Candidatus Clostridium radicumherbarum TaxID=3381662 RepID=A0ABW8TVZ2_9CLOT